MPRLAIFALTLGAASCACAPGALAERIDNGVAVFSALDKVTATIKTLEIPLNETTVFGALKVTPRTCYSRPSTEQPKTTSFVQVEEVQLDGQQKKIFSGWMFAESPGLNAVEHPVFDVWLTGCEKPKNAVAAKAPAPAPGGVVDPDAAAVTTDPAADPNAGELPRRRVKR
jgi:hypothetical protein